MQIFMLFYAGIFAILQMYKINTFIFVSNFVKISKNPLKHKYFKGFGYGRRKRIRTIDPHHVKVVL